jgi:transcriptional regulator with XRE-family HTH domain
MSAVLEAKHVGLRVAEARQRLALTQKNFAERVGVPLWTLDRIESGATDAANHLSRIADVTGLPEAWFGGVSRSAPAPTAAPLQMPGLVSRLRSYPAAGRDLVLGSIAVLVLVRFFTEVIHVIPRAANFVDIPIFGVLALAALIRPRGDASRRSSYMPLAVPATLFIGVALIATLLNLSRVQPGPVCVFLYGFIAPFGVYAAVYRLWPAGQALAMSRLLVGLGIIQLVIVFFLDVPRFVRGHNPDLISGTFGTNQYQLVFFSLVLIGLLAGISTFERGRLAARFGPLLSVLILATVFLAQYRALLATTFLTVLFIGLLLGLRGRGIVTGFFVGLAFVLTLLFVAEKYPSLRFGTTVSTLTRDPGFYASKKLRTANNVLRLYSDTPRFIVTGTGPGTFSSRGWQTFANAGSTSRSNVQGRYIRASTGGGHYHTDVSDKYVTATYQQGAVVQGSRAVYSPYSDYLSLLAEVGIFGFLTILFIYLRALVRSARLTLRLTAKAWLGDPLPALAIASTVGLFVLMQMAVLDNWLEVTRLSFLTWALLAVTLRELDARRSDFA